MAKDEKDEARKKKARLPVAKEIRAAIEERWPSIAQFQASSGIPVSYESVRAFLTDGKPVNALIVIYCAYYAGFRNKDIARFLEKLDETQLAELLDNASPIAIAPHEQALINAVNSLYKTNPATTVSLADFLAFLASSNKVDINKELLLIRRVDDSHTKTAVKGMRR